MVSGDDDLIATLRDLLGLSDGVILTDAEMDEAVDRAPEADREALRSGVIQFRSQRDILLSQRAPARRRFGGVA